jgi:hypothetical protein
MAAGAGVARTALARIRYANGSELMDDYNDKLIRAREQLFLDDTQREYLRFEEQALKDKYLAFLDRASSEAEMQCFLETNPAFIPGLYDRHNGPLGQVVVSKLRLGNEFITDFAFISVNSAEAQVNLVEIESPTAGIFRESDDQFTSNFNKAYQQVRDWGLWAEQNTTYLKDIFRTVYYRRVFSLRRVIVCRMLVAGRRSEIQVNARRETRWASVNHDPYVSVMSYDRLHEMFSLSPIVLKDLTCRPAADISTALKGR